MQTGTFKIDGIEFSQRTAERASFLGRFSSKELAGVNFRVHARSPQEGEIIDALFDRDTVIVEDPFVGRTYEATIHLSTSSYTAGEPAKYYTGEVREFDHPPAFNEIEINGYIYPVLAKREHLQDEENIVRYVIVRLTEDEFVALHQMIRQLDDLRIVQMRRVDVDESAFPARLGFEQYWSKHVDDGATYYKKILRLFPPLTAEKLKTAKSPLIASALELGLLRGSMTILQMRFEALCDALVERGALPSEKRDDIMGDKVDVLLHEARRERIFLESVLVTDAELVLEI